MVFTYTIDVDHNLVYVKCSGELIIDKFLEQMDQIKDDPLFDMRMDLLTELSEMIIKKDYSIIVKLILYVLTTVPEHKGRKWALVYPKTIDSIMIQLYKAISSSLDLFTQAFTTYEEANTWILDN